jgi:hypothetical protein
MSQLPLTGFMLFLPDSILVGACTKWLIFAVQDYVLSFETLCLRAFWKNGIIFLYLRNSWK